MKYKGHKRFYELLDEMRDLHDKKNQNYRSERDPLANFKLSEGFNVPPHLGVLIRISDKYSRLTRLASGTPDKVGESIIDTVMDMAVYCLIFIILYEEHNSRKNNRKN